MKNVTVYLGSRTGKSEIFCNNAYKIGKLLSLNNIGVIYGGASVGTMRALAEGVVENGGQLLGVFPKGFKGKKDNAAKGIDVQERRFANFIETKDLDERIRIMEEKSDGCIILPGSCGTLHEFISYHEGHDLGQHSKPIAILNTNGYYNPLIALIDNMIENGFASREEFGYIIVEDTPEKLVERISKEL
ncbi:MAG: TIGR00730 family Rossman fold protein [Bacteroidales bacterium]|nr:TIGR00730 family Rossman fold protein [Bacteroidales bacterium]